MLKVQCNNFFLINTDLIKIDVLDLQIGSICNPDEAFICAFSPFLLNTEYLIKYLPLGLTRRYQSQSFQTNCNCLTYHLNYFGIIIVRGGQRVVAFMVNPRPQTYISTNLHTII